MFACIYIPDFTVQAISRGEASLRDQAIAIVDGNPPLWTVVAANEKARRAGVELGMMKTQAAQFTPAQIRVRSRAQEVAAHAALLDLSYSFSPRIEDTAVDTVVLDLAGLERFGSSEEIARKLARRAAEFGLEAHVAVAANLDVAVHAARGFPGITLIPAGEESERLGCLPVRVLAPPVEILETLERWGVRTLKALAALPTAQLSERLGQEGVRLQELTRGTRTRSFIAAEVALAFEEVMELEYPVGELEPLAFIVGRLLDQLCARLSARALATNELRLKLELEASVEPYERTLRLPVPIRDSKTLLRLWRLHLQADPPQAPIIKVAIAAEPANPRVAQSGLFLPLSPDPEKLEATLARLVNLVGEDNIGSPKLLNTHRPGAFRMTRFNPPKEPTKASLPRRRACAAQGVASRASTSHRGNAPHVRKNKNGPTHNGSKEPSQVAHGASTMAFRVFRPPLRAKVQLRADVPARVSFQGIHGNVIAASGPWRTSGDWWTEDAWAHDEWDMEIQFVIPTPSPLAAEAQPQATKNGTRRGLYRIYCDLATGSWFVRGVYD